MPWTTPLGGWVVAPTHTEIDLMGSNRSKSKNLMAELFLWGHFYGPGFLNSSGAMHLAAAVLCRAFNLWRRPGGKGGIIEVIDFKDIFYTARAMMTAGTPCRVKVKGVHAQGCRARPPIHRSPANARCCSEANSASSAARARRWVALRASMAAMRVAKVCWRGRGGIGIRAAFIAPTFKCF